MNHSTLCAIVLSGLLCAAAACSKTTSDSASDGVGAAARTNAAGTTANNAPIQAKTYCAKLQSALQPLVKLPLALYEAKDSATDTMHPGERDFVDCDFRQGKTQIDIGLHDDSDHILFDDPDQKGYTALTGFGDKARAASAMGEHWVDVVRGSVACEARLGLADESQLNGEWKQAAGKMCEAAFAAR